MRITVDFWTIAKPLVLFLILPFPAGVGIRALSEHYAGLLLPMVQRLTSVFTAALLLICLILYGGDFVSVIGTFAIAAQFLFLILCMIFPYNLSPGLSHDGRVVLASAWRPETLARLSSHSSRPWERTGRPSSCSPYLFLCNWPYPLVPLRFFAAGNVPASSQADPP